MEVLFFLVPISLILAGGALVACIWAIKTGQFRDVVSPGEQLILEDKLLAAEESARIESSKGQSLGE